MINPADLIFSIPDLFGLCVYISESSELLYPKRPQTSNLDCAKVPGFDDRKSVHIPNIDRLAIVEPRELSRDPNSKSEAVLGINYRLVSHPWKAQFENFLGRVWKDVQYQLPQGEINLLLVMHQIEEKNPNQNSSIIKLKEIT
jgi:hypothetical protein